MQLAVLPSRSLGRQDSWHVLVHLSSLEPAQGASASENVVVDDRPKQRPRGAVFTAFVEYLLALEVEYQIICIRTHKVSRFSMLLVDIADMLSSMQSRISPFVISDRHAYRLLALGVCLHHGHGHRIGDD
eukprot:5343933-Pleurochrysis_carterae.AAC.1